MGLSSVEKLLSLNNIDRDLFEMKLSRTLLLGVFEAICKDMIKQNTKTPERERFRRRRDKLLATKSIVSRYAGCVLSDEGYVWLSKLLAAFFSTGDPRKQFDRSFRESLIKRQEYKCAICERTIGNDAHLDHIIPWQYVGDCLQDNYQMLCETCNTRKGNATYYELSMLLLNKGRIQF